MLRQIVELIPPYPVPKLAREHGIDARGFSPWSHVVAMVYAQLARATGLNEVCDALRLRPGEVLLLRAARPPAKTPWATPTRPATARWPSNFSGA